MKSCKLIAEDPRVQVEFGEERLILQGGLQPFMLATSAGTLVVQAQLPQQKPYGTRKMVFPHRMGTVVSRDGGNTWQRFVRKEGVDEVNIEGGAAELKDGMILALDTYVVASDKPGYGIGELALSHDDWHTLEEPAAVSFELTNIDIESKKDDGGHDHRAARLHRSMIELPDGDLLTTMYTWFYGDNVPCPYMPSMHKARTILYRSSDKGRTWRQIGSVVKSTDAGTEGFVEPVLVRLSQGLHEGRLLCLMRTGREMHAVYSDDEGVTWSEPKVELIGGIDVNRTELWAEQFRELNVPEPNEGMNELRGMYADPDLIELHNGVLVCAFGVRIPEKACWKDPTHPWNGNYVAFSLDQGESWSHVVQVTSGVLTAHYMSIRELAPNVLYVAYDNGAWNKPELQRVVGRRIGLSFRM